ncbi:hypothetical protein PHYBOEH_000554 [Phytophthora boehmeriae]|uniref:Uncharacterized protein n=1 Tax=Phytophthora boehmeriae TaxID=109152 RepID=A0A8T1WWK9_9STRA|nr:hypothetical protein PHYBOEH_000554 [Phytophthora boehmeriae]
MAVEKLSSNKAKHEDKGVDVSLSQQQEEYEDDYESDTKEASGVAGMTLSDYLHVKDEAADEKVSSRAGSLRMAPSHQAPAKKASPVSDVSGMSLDLYLGAEEADQKPSPKVKRKSVKSKHTGSALPQTKPSQPSFALKGSSLAHVPQVNNVSSQDQSSEEESSSKSPTSSLTPFQRRQKRKERAKQKLQQRNEGGGLVSKAILMPETVRDKEKEKRTTSLGASGNPHHSVHHGSQHPLPKLAPSPSVRSLHHRDHDSSGNLYHDDNGDEKLPPL